MRASRLVELRACVRLKGGAGGAVGRQARRLGAGDWVHIFPEGRVKQARAAAARVICPRDTTRIFYPEFHREIHPGGSYFPGDSPGTGALGACD